MSDSVIGEGQIANIVSSALSAEMQGAEAGAQPGDMSAADREAAQVHAELLEAAEVSASGAEPGIRLPSIAAGEGDGGEQTHEQIRALRDVMMKRAAKQRLQGAAGLERVEAGVAAYEFEAHIKDRVLSSAFLRWFSAVDICVGNLQRRGEMLLGGKAADLIDQVADLIGNVERDAASEIERVRTLVAVAQKNDPSGMFVTPKITTPALTKNVKIRSKLGWKLYLALRNYDDALELMNALVWNDVFTEDQAAEQQLQYKRAFGALYRFAARANINLFNKFTRRRSNLRKRKDDSADAEVGAGTTEAAEQPSAETV